MSPSPDAILARARDTAAQMNDRLARWCAIPSHAANPPGQRQMANVVAGAFGRVRGRVEQERVGPGGLSALHIRSPERAGPCVLLVGHYDTVPHDGPSPEPEVVLDGNRIWARGAADMKGGLVVMLAAIQLLEAGAGSPPPWMAIVVPDEELGTPWSRSLLVTAAESAAAALVFEPALPDGRIVRARKGVGTVTIVVRGRSAHAGRNPDLGRSAIAALAEVVGRIEALADGHDGTTVAVTTIGGGSAANAIPAEARAQVDVRVERQTEAERVLAGIEQACEEIGRRRSVEIVADGGVHRPPRPVDSATEAIFDCYRTGARAMGIEVDWTDVGGGSDANLLPATVPALDGLGVVGGGLHAPDEYADIRSLPERAALAACLIARIGSAAVTSSGNLGEHANGGALDASDRGTIKD